MDRPSVAPWRLEATGAEDPAGTRFLRAAYNYVWAKALGWNAKASGGPAAGRGVATASTTETEEV